MSVPEIVSNLGPDAGKSGDVGADPQGARAHRPLVIAGFAGVLVMLAPHLEVGRSAAAVRSAPCSGSRERSSARPRPIQTRVLTTSETTSSIVFYFSLICALFGLCTWPFGGTTPTWPEFAALAVIGIFGGLAHIFLTESYRFAPASVGDQAGRHGGARERHGA